LLVGGDIAGVFEFMEVGAEVAVGFLEQIEEAGEGECVGGGKEDAGAKAGAVFEEGIKAGEVAGG